MDSKSEALRRRLELYRGYLRDGVAGNLAIEYLRQIAEDTAELAKIELRKQQQEHSSNSRHPRRDR